MFAKFLVKKQVLATAHALETLRVRDIDVEMQRMTVALKDKRIAAERRAIEDKINQLQMQRVRESAPREYGSMLAALG